MGQPSLRRNVAERAAQTARSQTAAGADRGHSGASLACGSQVSKRPDFAIPGNRPTENAAPESSLEQAGGAEVRNLNWTPVNDRCADRQGTEQDFAEPDCAGRICAGREDANQKRVSRDLNPGANRSSDHDEGHAEGRDADHAWNRSSKAFSNTISSGGASGANSTMNPKLSEFASTPTHVGCLILRGRWSAG